MQNPGLLCTEEEQRTWQSVSMQRKERCHLARWQAKVWLCQGRNVPASCRSASSHVSINCHLLQPQLFPMAVSCPTPLTPALCCGTRTHNATNSSDVHMPESDCTQRGTILNKPGDGREAAEHLTLLPGANSIPKTSGLLPNFNSIP